MLAAPVSRLQKGGANLTTPLARGLCFSAYMGNGQATPPSRGMMSVIDSATTTNNDPSPWGPCWRPKGFTTSTTAGMSFPFDPRLKTIGTSMSFAITIWIGSTGPSGNAYFVSVPYDTTWGTNTEVIGFKDNGQANMGITCRHTNGTTYSAKTAANSWATNTGWRTLVATREGATFRFWNNATEWAASSPTMTSSHTPDWGTASPPAVVIGNRTISPNNGNATKDTRWFSAHIWNRPLTPGEVRTLIDDPLILNRRPR